MSNKPVKKECELCGKSTNFPAVNLNNCDHPKNGYCAYFRFIAKQDEKGFNMRVRDEATTK